MVNVDDGALRDVATELNEAVQYLDCTFAVLSHTQRALEQLVYATRRLAAITAVDASLRCPWNEISQPMLVHELAKLTKVALAEAYDDVSIQEPTDA